MDAVPLEKSVVGMGWLVVGKGLPAEVMDIAQRGSRYHRSAERAA